MGLESLLASQIIGLAEAVDDEVATLLVAGTGITLTYNDGANTLTIASSGGIGGSTGSTDNRVLRADGTGGATVQNSAVTIDDSGNISGLGTVGCGAITASGGTVTSSTPVFSGSQTWNNGAVAFVGLSLNITSTASSTSSQLFNFVVNGTSRLAADVGGHLTVQTGGIGNSNQTRVNFNGTTSQQFLVNNATAFQIFSDSIAIGTLGTNVRIYGAFTVATLPSAAANAGALAQVTDSSVTTNGSPVAGGGSSRVVVFCNGSTWDVVVA